MSGHLLLMAAAMAAPVPPPIIQHTADCERPTNAIDQLVCGDPALAALDRQLADLLHKLTADRLRGPLIEDQKAWFRRSRLCAFQKEERRCTNEAYQERIAELSALLAPPPAMTMQCHAGRTRFAASMNGATLSIMAGTDIVGLAIPPAPHWVPFLSFAGGGSRLTLLNTKRSVVAICRTSP